MFKLIAGLAAIFVLVISIGMVIAAWSALPVMALIAISLSLLIATAAALVGIYWLLGKAKIDHAQAYAVRLEACKIHANNSALVMGKQIIVLPAGQLGYGVTGNLSHYAPQYTITHPAQLAQPVAATLIMPTEQTAQAGPAIANFFDFVPADPFKQGELFLSLGVAANGSLINRPITKLTHFLGAGKTQSGKSTQQRSLAAQTLIGELSRPGRAQVALIDLTGITFNADLFADLPQTYGGEVIRTAEGAIGMLDTLLRECERRSRLYSQARGLPESLPEFNAVAPAEYQLPVILTFIEEMSALADYAGDKFLSPLKRLIWQARKYGIYLNNAGQDFRAQTCDKTITDNSSTRFIFGQVEDNTARVIGFNPKINRVSIDRPGRGLVMLNGQIQEFQGLFLAKDQFIELINQLRDRSGLAPVGVVDSFHRAGPAAPPRTAQEAWYKDNLGNQPYPAPGVLNADYRQLPPAPNELERASRAWQAGHNSVRKLATVLNVSEWQARKLIETLRAQSESV